MTRMIRCALAVATLGLLASAAGAADRGTAAEARALLDQAASHYQQAGRQAALADFNKPNGSFVKNDLYVFCIGPDNKVDAHAANPQLVGTEAQNLKDANGNVIGTRIVEIGQQQGTGTLEYPYMNPATQKVEQKETFIRKLGEDVCGVGYYK